MKVRVPLTEVGIMQGGDRDQGSLTHPFRLETVVVKDDDGGAKTSYVSNRTTRLPLWVLEHGFEHP